MSRATSRGLLRCAGVHTVAAVPAAALLAGAAAGLLLPDLALALPLSLMTAGVIAIVWAWSAGRTPFLAPAVAFTFFAGGAAASVDAWHDAWRPPLRDVYDAARRAERASHAARGHARPAGESVQMTVIGVLLADASPGENGVSLRIDVRQAIPAIRRMEAPPIAADSHAANAAPVDTGVGTRGGVQLSVGGAIALERVSEWRAGRTVRVVAQLRRPSRYLNPGMPNQERALARRGTTLVGSVKSGALVEVVSPGGFAAERAATARAHVRRIVHDAVGRWSVRSAAIVTAILIGDRAGLDDDVRQRLQEAGTYHVIAISGGNIAILAGLALVAFRIAGVFGRAAMLTAIGALTAYAWLVGGGASVDRATLMAVVYFGGRAIDLRGAPLNALALVAGLLVAVDPLAIADAAFLLTCGATAGILCAVPLVGSGFSRISAGSSQVSSPIHRFAGAAAALLAASVAAEAMLLPVGAYLFSRVTFAGLVLNFAAIPLMAITQLAGLALLPAALLSTHAAAAIGWVAHAAADGLVQSARLVDVVPALTWRVAPPHPAAMAGYYAALLTAWTLSSRAVRAAGAEPVRFRAARHSAVALCAAAAIWIAGDPWPLAADVLGAGRGRLRVAFIDVGQGDAVHVRFPGGRSLLVDTGGLAGASSFDVGDRVVGAALRHQRVRRLETLVITHGDADHVGGAEAILRDFRPREVWDGVPVPSFPPLRAVRNAADAAGARWATLHRHAAVSIDGVNVLIRHPPVPDWERQQVRNDDSLVIELLWRDFSIVLTGDISREVEREILPLFAPAPLRVVKAPHHGSLTSSSAEFVDALAPRVAVVSAGRGNPFGHPAPAVLERYYRAGAEVFRTDREGAITIDTDGYTLDVRTYTGRTLTLP